MRSLERDGNIERQLLGMPEVIFYPTDVFGGAAWRLDGLLVAYTGPEERAMANNGPPTGADSRENYGHIEGRFEAEDHDLKNIVQLVVMQSDNIAWPRRRLESEVVEGGDCAEHFENFLRMKGEDSN